MNKVQEDTLSMYQTTNDVLVSNATVYAANVPFTTAAGLLADNIEIIENLRDQQEEDIRGVTQDKQYKRQTLEDSAHQAGSIITFYASVTNNRSLLQKVNFTRTELSRSRDNELPGMAEQVHQEAVANAAALVPYGLTGAMTTALRNAIDAFVDYISKPRAAKTETSAATEQLPPVFDTVNALLEEQLDKGMELYRVSFADFYAQYFGARVIVNSPTQKRALQATFVNSATSQPVAHVNILVDSSINRRSSELGNIYVQNLAEGGHEIKATLPGYQDVVQNFNVIDGETTKLTISMISV